MKRLVKLSEIIGEISAPPSKSETLRAVACALLAGGESYIENPSYCRDAVFAFKAAESFGAKIIYKGKSVIIDASEVSPLDKINCGESGFCARLFSAISALFDKEIIIDGEGSLKKRRLTDIEGVLSGFGVKAHSNDGFLPVIVSGGYREKKVDLILESGSQILSGLLIALASDDERYKIAVENLKSKPYIDLTLYIMSRFGANIIRKGYDYFEIPAEKLYNPAKIKIGGDWSGAAFMLVAAATSGSILLKGLDANSMQGDRIILDVLAEAGAEIEFDYHGIKVTKGALSGFEFDARDYPDLFPPLTALAFSCEGRSRIRGVERLRRKESDRAKALVEEYTKIGGQILIDGDYLVVDKSKLKGGEANSRGDHRIAMSFAIAALNAEAPVSIYDAECVSKSYPSFFDDLKLLGANII